MSNYKVWSLVGRKRFVSTISGCSLLSGGLFSREARPGSFHAELLKSWKVLLFFSSCAQVERDVNKCNYHIKGRKYRVISGLINDHVNIKHVKPIHVLYDVT